MPGEQPTATAGPLFISIYPNGETEVARTPQLIQVSHSIGICLSARLRASPEDRDGVRIAASQGLLQLAGTVRGLVSHKMSLAVLANATEPLTWTSTGAPVGRYKDWWWSDDPYDNDLQPTGYSITIQFGGGLKLIPVQC